MRARALACWLALGLGCGLAARGPAARDPIAQDPPFDAALSSEVVFGSSGSRLFGLVYEAPAAGPHPTAIVLHGFPDNERNLDLAQAIRRAGWNADHAFADRRVELTRLVSGWLTSECR